MRSKMFPWNVWIVPSASNPLYPRVVPDHCRYDASDAIAGACGGAQNKSHRLVLTRPHDASSTLLPSSPPKETAHKMGRADRCFKKPRIFESVIENSRFEFVRMVRILERDEILDGLRILHNYPKAKQMSAAEAVAGARILAPRNEPFTA